jgi:hypothetical protein
MLVHGFARGALAVPGVLVSSQLRPGRQPIKQLFAVALEISAGYRIRNPSVAPAARFPFRFQRALTHRAALV